MVGSGCHAVRGLGCRTCPDSIRSRATVLRRSSRISSSEPCSSASACGSSRRTPTTGASASWSGPSGNVPCEAQGFGQARRQGRLAITRLPRDGGGAVGARARQTRAGSPYPAVKRIEHREPMAGDRVMTRAQQRAQAARDRRARDLAADDVDGLVGSRLAAGISGHAQRSSLTERPRPWMKPASSSCRRSAASGTRIQRRRRSLSSIHCSMTVVTRIR